MFYRASSERPLNHKTEFYFSEVVPLADILAGMKNLIADKYESTANDLLENFRIDDNAAYRVREHNRRLFHSGNDNSGNGNTETQKPSS